ncbi:MAG: peptide chain release factor N(5)-glutamine methyltransferase [Candidatus Cloacimonetes bacterium]|nr:peptide chain release factor N(5)-glutamine methyltransferase [Candidatus Cloacimonadota bacterium]
MSDVNTVQDPSWTLLSVLQAAQPWLERRGVPSPRRDAEELLAHCLSCSRLDLYLDHDRPLSPEERASFRELLRRRGMREPLQYLLGTQPFRMLDLKVDSRALIPRTETEEVVEYLLQAERALGPLPGRRMLDIGTGSGSIALSLLKELPGSRVTALDRSADALALCHENAQRLGLLEGLELLKLDILEDVPEGSWQVVVANPPYVSSLERGRLQPELSHEPEMALYAEDPAGLQFYRRIAELLPRLLVPGGRCCLEIGHGQGAAILGLFKEVLVESMIINDLAGRERIFFGRRS